MFNTNNSTFNVSMLRLIHVIKALVFNDCPARVLGRRVTAAAAAATALDALLDDLDHLLQPALVPA